MNRTGLAAAMFFCLVVLGCDQDWPDRQEASIIEGTIEYEGQSLVDATVVFVPQLFQHKGKRVPLARAKTDSQGKFLLTADGVDDSLSQQIIHGNYRVIVSRQINGSETLPGDFNRDSELRYRHETQEAYSRPAFRLRANGLFEQE